MVEELIAQECELLKSLGFEALDERTFKYENKAIRITLNSNVQIIEYLVQTNEGTRMFLNLDYAINNVIIAEKTIYQKDYNIVIKREYKNNEIVITAKKHIKKNIDLDLEGKRICEEFLTNSCVEPLVNDKILDLE